MPGNLRKKALTNVAVSLSRESLDELVIHFTLNAINKFERKISGRGAVRAGKGLTLFTSNEGLNYIIIS